MELRTAENGGDLTTDFKKMMNSPLVLPGYSCMVSTIRMRIVKPLHHLPIRVSHWLSALQPRNEDTL